MTRDAVIRVAALDASLAPAWSELFAACASSCFCRYWHFEGNKNEWLARCAHDATRNRDEQLACVAAMDPATVRSNWERPLRGPPAAIMWPNAVKSMTAAR